MLVVARCNSSVGFAVLRELSVPKPDLNHLAVKRCLPQFPTPTTLSIVLESESRLMKLKSLACLSDRHEYLYTLLVVL